MNNSPFISPAEANIARFTAAKAYLKARGCNVKRADDRGGIPYFDVTGKARAMTRDGVVQEARRLGWDGE